MPDPTKLIKAQLIELDADFKNKLGSGKEVTVQFNPDSLKVSFANQIVTPSGAGDQRGSPSRQFVGAGTTKLSLQLWFDVTSNSEDEKTVNRERVSDVRKLTENVAYFITPKQQAEQFIPPAVRFLWGTFQFDGIVESMEESLEFFSSEGVPLRASTTLMITQQKITKYSFAAEASPLTGALLGTRPLTQAVSGSSLQGLAAAAGRINEWQSIASANGIENPRILQPGQLIDLNTPLISRFS